MWMVMRRKWMVGFLMLNAFEVVVLTFLVMPAARAADADAAEAVDLSAVRAAIEAESDPELRAIMTEELEALESRGGEMKLTEGEHRGGRGAGPGIDPGSVWHQLPDGSVLLPGGIVGGDGTGGQTTDGKTTGGYLPKEAQAELEKIFSQGTGDPSKDGHLREQAEKILEKYGIEHTEIGNYEGKEGEMTSPREAFQQWEGSEQGQRTDSATREQYREMSEQYQAEFEQRGEGFERAMTEHMAPEAREQMERFMNERDMQDHEMSREGMEREMGGTMEREFGAPTSEREHSFESPTRETETSTREYEAPTHEYEAPTVERSYEAPTREYEAPTHEYEAPTHEYEAPQQEYQSPERAYQY